MVDEVIDVMTKLGGIARAKDLAGAGLTRRSISAAAAVGLIERVRPGLYAIPGADPLLRRCAETNSLLTCASAASRLGLWVVEEPKRIHLLRPDGTFRSDLAVIHRRSWISAERGGHLASTFDAVMHALLCLPEPEALVIVESAVNQKRVTVGELRGYLTGPGSRSALAVLGHLDRGADSFVETLARYYLRKAGLGVRPQVDVEGVGPMDLLVEECVDVETDGKLHERPSARANDYARDAAAHALGIPTVRFTFRDVVRTPDLMVAKVKRVVERRLAMGPLPVFAEVETTWRKAHGAA